MSQLIADTLKGRLETEEANLIARRRQMVTNSLDKTLREFLHEWMKEDEQIYATEQRGSLYITETIVGGVRFVQRYDFDPYGYSNIKAEYFKLIKFFGVICYAKKCRWSFWSRRELKLSFTELAEIFRRHTEAVDYLYEKNK